jgi:Spy/CpxP family protein refolding chaperone
MFGFIVGTLSLWGLIKVAKSGRHGWHRRGGGRWGQWMFRRLFERLDTTPGQERVVLDAADEAQRVMWKARDEVMRARSDYAKAMRSEHFDAEALNAAFERQQASIDEVKKTLREKLQSIHEILTPSQRASLADLIEFGPSRFAGGWHHRHHHRHWRTMGNGPSAVNV